MARTRKTVKATEEYDDDSQGVKNSVSEIIEVSDNEVTDKVEVEHSKETINGHEQDLKTNKNVSKTSKSKTQALLMTKRFTFIFGALLGIIIAIYFGGKHARDNDILPELDQLINFDHFSNYIDEWKDKLPLQLQGFLETTNADELHNSGEAFAVGRSLKKENYGSKYPVILVPGVISTGLESWSLEGTPECPSSNHFRKRLWGSFYMLRTMFLDKNCWLKHIMLDEETGLDPPGIKIRAAQGFEAADFFITGYWIWNKIIQNLAVIGYGPENMLSASYDWRLSYLDLERRDGYFSKLKSQIEVNKKLTGEKTILYGHSMGSQVIFYFLKWVEAEGEHFGNGGSNWCNDYIEAFVDISGCVLGTPKAIVALLSGEMKDTVQLNALAVQGLEKFFSRRERADLLRSFGGIASMIPKGGELIWGDLEKSPDDLTRIEKNPETVNDTSSLGNFIRFSEEVGIFSNKNLTIDESIEFLLSQTPKWFQDRTKEHYSYGYTTKKEELEANEKDFSKWSNPLEVPLPNAPDMKIYCLYGVGAPTERAYYYREEKDKDVTKLNVTIDIEHPESVLFSDGDGTVSLMTHSMCHKWAQGNGKNEGDETFENIYNPGNSKVTVVEIKHEPDRFDIRGGAKTADHVDILGSSALNELVLKIAAGHGDEIEDNIITSLREIVAGLDF